MSQIKAWEPQADGPGGFADESALVAGLRTGTPEAFEAFHAAYAASIYNLALRIVDDPHEAQDVAQEVLIKVLRGLPQDERDLTLPAWLYRVTVNASFDHLRARKRRPVTVSSEAVSEPVSKVDEFERAELARRVETTLRELPKRQQVALVLRDVHGLSVGETASALGLTKGSADVLLSRARAGFRKVFLAGAATGRCVEAEKILAGGVGGGTSAADSALLAEHTRTCPDCRREVALWGAAPVGLGLLLPQVALPAKLSFGATLAAAQAAGVALPAGLGAAAAASAAGAGGSGAGAAAAAASAATAAGAGSAATAAGGAGVLAALGSAAGLKIATLAAVATAAVGIAGVAAHERATTGRTASDVPAAMAQGQGAPGDSGGGADAGDGRRARQLTQAHRGGVPGSDGRARGTRADGAAGQRSQKADPGRGAGTTSGAQSGGGSSQSGGSASAGGAGGTTDSGTSQTGTGSGGGGSTGSVGGTGSTGGTGSGSGAGGGDGSGTGGGTGQPGGGGGQSSGD